MAGHSKSAPNDGALPAGIGLRDIGSIRLRSCNVNNSSSSADPIDLGRRNVCGTKPAKRLHCTGTPLFKYGGC